VLIVKQMAARGNDAPRCKVLLDLSQTRTEVSWIQRTMRVNRLYKGLTGHIISVDDILSRTLWDKIVRFSTEASSQTYRVIEDLVDEYLVEIRPKSQDWRALFIGDAANADFSDSNLVSATADAQPVVRFLFDQFPALNLVASRPSVATTFGGWTPPAHLAHHYVERPDIRAGDERKAIGKELWRLAMLLLGAQSGDRTLISKTMGRLWNETKAQFGLSKNIAVDKLTDLTILGEMKKYVIGRHEDEKHRRRTTQRP